MGIKLLVVFAGYLALGGCASVRGEEKATTKPSPTIYDQRNNPTTLEVAERSESKLGVFLRDAGGTLLTTNVPDATPIVQGSLIWTGTIDVARSTLPGTQYQGSAAAFFIEYSPPGRGPIHFVCRSRRA